MTALPLIPFPDRENSPQTVTRDLAPVSPPRLTNTQKSARHVATELRGKPKALPVAGDYRKPNREQP
jgi:hypothetical protein